MDFGPLFVDLEVGPKFASFNSMDLFYLSGFVLFQLIKGELPFGGRWALKLTKGPYNSSN